MGFSLGDLFRGPQGISDEAALEAAQLTQESMSNADMANVIKAITGKDLRDLPVKEAVSAAEQVRLLKMGKDRN